MQYMVDDILTGIDDAKANAMLFMEKYGFHLPICGQVDVDHNKALYAKLKKDWAFLRDPTKVSFYLVICNIY
jgi:hypothetical protein